MKSKYYYTVYVQGKTKEYGFDTKCYPEFIDEMREQGINIDLLNHSVPKWAVNMGLWNVWCWLQDIGLLRP
jgi:hypothetical protein